VDATDVLLVAARWLHGLAAVVWIGAAMFELLVIWPAFEGGLPDGLRTTLDAASREIVQTALAVFLLSGAILTFERLTHNAAGPTYVALLGLKLVLAVAMFQVAFRFRRATGQRRIVGLRSVAALGLLILFLAAVLKSIYERALLP
jgi:uncharacterized membrane protein